MQDRPVQLNLPTRQTTAQDLLAAHNSLLASVAEGTLTPLEAEAVSKLLEARRRSWESVEMEDRMLRLPDDANAVKKIGPPPPNIQWVESHPMPSQAEQARLDALEMEEDMEEDDEAKDSDRDRSDKDDTTNKDKKETQP